MSAGKQHGGGALTAGSPSLPCCAWAVTSSSAANNDNIREQALTGSNNTPNPPFLVTASDGVADKREAFSAFSFEKWKGQIEKMTDRERDQRSLFVRVGSGGPASSSIRACCAGGTAGSASSLAGSCSAAGNLTACHVALILLLPVR